MGINKFKCFLNISCLLFLICFTTFSISTLTYAQVGLSPESFNSSVSSLPSFGSTGGFGFPGFGATSFSMPSYGGSFSMPSYGGSFSMPSYGGSFSMPTSYGGGFNASPFGGTSFNMPSYSASAFGATSFGMPASYSASPFGATNFGMSNYGGSYSASAFGNTSFSMPNYGGGFGTPVYGSANFGMPTSYGASPFGATSFGLNSYSAPAFGGIGYGMPAYGASPFGATSFGLPSYGAPMGYGSPLGGLPIMRGAMGYGLPIGGFGLPMGYNGYNPYGYLPTSGGSSSSYSEPEYESGFYTEDELPSIKGYWSGRWEAFETDNDGVVTDPNGQIIIAKEGELSVHIKSQKSSGGRISGTIEITEWNIDEYPDWEGESEEIELTGWLDEANGWFNVHYFYFTGTELESDYSNLISDFLWNFHNLEINASESGIFGQFRVRGKVEASAGVYEDYDLIGKFQLGKYVPDK